MVEPDRYQGDENALGPEGAELGPSGRLGLNDQGLLVFQGSSGVKMA